jgi:catechol 2,3-dioxygenase-like lactoylglutathione lyase family enzyme
VVSFKCKDPQQLKNWYEEHLGFNTDEYGTNFEWRQVDEQKASLNGVLSLRALNTSRRLIRSL